MPAAGTAGELPPLAYHDPQKTPQSYPFSSAVIAMAVSR
jgi:hypothetical protein